MLYPFSPSSRKLFECSGRNAVPYNLVEVPMDGVRPNLHVVKVTDVPKVSKHERELDIEPSEDTHVYITRTPERGIRDGFRMHRN